MQKALHIKTKILSGNKLEIDVPLGTAGEPVDVFVILPETPPQGRGSVLAWLEQVRSQRPLRTAEDIDKQLQAEKNSWDS